MSKVVAIAGLGDDAPPASSKGAMLIWFGIFGVTVGIFVGTLMLNPGKRRP